MYSYTRWGLALCRVLAVSNTLRNCSVVCSLQSIGSRRCGCPFAPGNWAGCLIMPVRLVYFTALSGTARSPAFTTLVLLSSLLMGTVLYKEVFHGFFRLVARSANCCVRMDACHLGTLASVWRMFCMLGALGLTARSLSNLGAFLMCSLAASLHLFLCVARTAALDAFSGFRSNAR
ncbi:hypothetical protein E4T56_gene12767, partial [Termitomyces sp. T112]